MAERPAYAVRAVLFDLDGTLLDTIHDLADGANRMLLELGRPTRSLAEIHSFVGKGIPNLVARCLSGETPASAAELEHAVSVFRRHYTIVNGLSTLVYDGVPETLQALRDMGLRLACVTNKAGAFVAPLLARMGIEGYFDCVVAGDTLAVKKPDPATLHHACRLLAVSAGEALMIGDSANDAEAARAAGMPVFLVSYGYSEGRPVGSIDCDALLSSMRQALPLIRAAS